MKKRSVWDMVKDENITHLKSLGHSVQLTSLGFMKVCQEQMKEIKASPATSQLYKGKVEVDPYLTPIDKQPCAVIPSPCGGRPT